MKGGEDKDGVQRAWDFSQEQISDDKGAHAALDEAEGLCNGSSPPSNPLPDNASVNRSGTVPIAKRRRGRPAEAERTERDEQPSMPRTDDREAAAIALLFMNPHMRLAEIAEKVGVSRQTLYRWQKFREAAIKADKLKPRDRKAGNIPRGYKTKDGQMEAYDDQSDRVEDDE
jgi:hypothetical protein